MTEKLDFSAKILKQLLQQYSERWEKAFLKWMKRDNFSEK